MPLGEAISELLRDFGFVLTLSGFVVAFFGWRLHEAIVEIIGFVVGVVVGIPLSAYLVWSESVGALDGTGWLLVIGIILFCGYAVSEAFKELERVAVAIPGFLCGSFIGVLLLQRSIGQIFSPIPFVFGFGVGYLFWLMYKAGIILYTGFLGAFLVSFGSVLSNGEWYGLTETSRLFSGMFWLVFLAGAATQAGIVAKTDQLSENTRTQWETLIHDFLKEPTGWKYHLKTASTTQGGPQPSFKELMVVGLPETATQCPGCGHICLKNDKFCQGCGSRLSKCPSCDALSLDGWDYCQTCGTELGTHAA